MTVVVIELDTPRLRLRQWRASDRAPFAALNADPRVRAHFPALLSRAESDASMDRCQAMLRQRGWGNWAVELRSRPQFIGFVGLSMPALEMPFSPCVEIGWRLARAYWGQGYASEAAHAALRVGFEQAGLEEIVSFTALDNTPSQAVMQRIGMQRAQDFEHPGLPPGHRLRTHCLYRLSKAQWQALPSGAAALPASA
jgi:RimJ/RimL family protein N-acetyltransferase